VHGVGKLKLERYGADLLALLLASQSEA